MTSPRKIIMDNDSGIDSPNGAVKAKVGPGKRNVKGAKKNATKGGASSDTGKIQIMLVGL